MRRSPPLSRKEVQTALRLYIEYKKAHPEVATALQEQADSALRYFSFEGNLRWVSLLLWVGANPRSRGPCEEDDDNPNDHTTALTEACRKGNLAVLKKFKIDPRIDDVTELLSSAALAPFTAIIEYLLSFGAKVNDKCNGGSSAIDHCLCHLGCRDWPSLPLPSLLPFPNQRFLSKYDVSATIDRIRLFVKQGALWRPDDRNKLNWVRKALYECEPAVIVNVVRLLARNRACTEETLEELLDTPRMREHLSQLDTTLIATSSKRPRLRR